jgi:hypothetical protein
VTLATGANAADIQPAVTSFRTDLGSAACVGSCRNIGWDGVPDERSDPAFMPEGQFIGAGALFRTPAPGIGVQVSGDTSTPFADPDLPDFGETNPTYINEFEAFSAPRMFTSIGSNVIETRFVVPNIGTPADTNCFGVVFSDVDVEGPTTMQYFNAKGKSLGTFTVPATAGQQTFSFLGVIFDKQRIAPVLITQGTRGIAPGVNDAPPATDLVVTDDFMFGFHHRNRSRGSRRSRTFRVPFRRERPSSLGPLSSRGARAGERLPRVISPRESRTRAAAPLSASVKPRGTAWATSQAPVNTTDPSQRGDPKMA